MSQETITRSSGLRRAAAILSALVTAAVGITLGPAGNASADVPLLNGVYQVRVDYSQRTVNYQASPSAPADILFAIQTSCGPNAGCTGLGVVMYTAELR